MLETKYIELSEKIAEGIKKGLWQERLPGVIKLSKELNADPATISKAFKVLADKGLVTINGKKGTFITKPGSRVRHNVIGIIGIDTTSEQLTGELRAMEENAASKGFSIIGIAHNNQLFVNAPDLLMKFPVDGYVFMYSTLTFELAAFLRNKGIPFVSCNDPAGIPGVNWVDFDSEISFKKALRHLISIGHKNIAYAEFFNPNYNYTERMIKIYKETFLEAGLPFREEFIYSSPKNDYFEKHGDNPYRRHGIDIAKKILSLKNKPSAIIMVSTDTAYGFAEHFKHCGFKIPDDMTVITYNGNRKDMKEDFFAVINNDYKKRASEAARLLISIIKNPIAEPQHILIDSIFLENKSCKPLVKEF